MTLLSYPDPELTDGVVRLRRWREDDLDGIEQAGLDPRIPRGTTVPASFSPSDGLAFIHRQWARLSDGEGVSQAIALADSDRAVGLLWLALRPQPGVAGIGYWLIPCARGEGLAARAADLVTDWTIRQVGLARVEAWVERDNVASQRTLLKAGFASEGVLRNFLQGVHGPADAVVFSRVAEP